jgi:hypothetical protein
MINMEDVIYGTRRLEMARKFTLSALLLVAIYGVLFGAGVSIRKGISFVPTGLFSLI